MRLARLLALLLFASVACAQPVQLPDTPAAHQCAAWLKAFDGTDREAYGSFLERNFPSRVVHRDQDWDFRARTGGFELRKVEESAPTKLVALLQERGCDQFARISLEVDPAEPHIITRFG